MDPIASFQGLATGIKFRDLVDKIIAAESRPITLMKARTELLTRRAKAWREVTARVQDIQARAAGLADGSAFNVFRTTVGGYTNRPPLAVSAGPAAASGSFAMAVQRIATHEKLSGGSVADRSAALGIEGEFLVGGRAVAVTASDTLDDVAASLNRVNRGAQPSGVSASVMAAGDGYRLVLTAAKTGAAGVQLADGAGGALVALGFLDGSTALKHGTSNGARSDTFLSGTEAVGKLLGLSVSPASASVKVGALTVALDLGTDSLADVAGRINAAATAASSSIRAEVVTGTDASGVQRSRLGVTGTTSFTDAAGVLQTLGVLSGGRGAVAQQVEGGVLTAGDGVSPAAAATLLTDVWSGGAHAGVQVGDTLTLSGTRGDGTTFTKTFTVGAGSTYGDLAGALGSAVDGFGAGSRPATVSIDEAMGRLVVLDGTSGDSRLAVSVVAHNQGGGTLDLGAFTVAESGRARVLTRGVDAAFTVDGVSFTRSSNTVTDLSGGLTVSLQEATGEEVTVDVARDANSAAATVEALFKGFNGLTDVVNSHFTGSGGEEGGTKRPLAGDNLLRGVRSRLGETLESVMASAVTDVSRLHELGITMGKDGNYSVDASALKTALESDHLSVQRYFAAYGVGSHRSLTFEAASSKTTSGSYDVWVSTLAQRATATTAGFSGAYVDDGTPDTLTVTDAATGWAYAVALSHGMTLMQITDALNLQFATATTREIHSGVAFHSDAVGSPADASTLLSGLHGAGGVTLGVAPGDVLTLSGEGSGGASFFVEWTVHDPSTQTLGDLAAALGEAMGTGVTVEIAGGRIVARAQDPGGASFTFSVSSNDGGGGSFGTVAADVVVAGRGTTAIRAGGVGGELALAHDEYGAAEGFDVAFAAAGWDGTASLGLTVGSYRGVDVAGTLGGQAATGTGRVLTGAEGMAAEGLAVTYSGVGTGAVGSVRFSRGIASLTALVAGELLGTGVGSLKSKVDAIDTQKQGIEVRIERFEDRLDRRAESLIRRFSALEAAMAKAQQQMSWIQAQLGALTATAKK
jgi:flagellar hook-associated protein 2